jgi:ribonuclease HII
MSMPSATVEPIVAGVDEVGRGPLAGPVVAAAVVLDPAHPVEGLRDSKALSSRRRRVLARAIRCSARAFAIGFATVEEIDRLNILQASLLAMERALDRLGLDPDIVLVDGNRAPAAWATRRSLEVQTVVHGDRSVPEISAASIIGKVCRDRLLDRWHRRYPEYGFERNKGYATAQHLDAISAHGITPIHRRSFAPVRRIWEGEA